MIVLDTHIWVNWILGGNAALTPVVVDAMQKESCLAVSAISCFEGRRADERSVIRRMGFSYGGRRYAFPPYMLPPVHGRNSDENWRLRSLPQAGRAKREGRSQANESLREFHVKAAAERIVL